MKRQPQIFENILQLILNIFKPQNCRLFSNKAVIFNGPQYFVISSFTAIEDVGRSIIRIEDRQS
jgi:hypothetical protein